MPFLFRPYNHRRLRRRIFGRCAGSRPRYLSSLHYFFLATARRATTSDMMMADISLADEEAAFSIRRSFRPYFSGEELRAVFDYGRFHARPRRIAWPARRRQTGNFSAFRYFAQCHHAKLYDCDAASRINACPTWTRASPTIYNSHRRYQRIAAEYTFHISTFFSSAAHRDFRRCGRRCYTHLLEARQIPLLVARRCCQPYDGRPSR